MSPATTTSGSILVQGFEDICHPVSNPTGQLHWYCAPESWAEKGELNSREGQDGSWQVQAGALILKPPAQKDFWRRTYYEPLLIKDDGPMLYRPLSRHQHYTLETAFTLTAARQFDQAGLMVRLDAEHWIKTGIEVVDGQPRLSCVVTNVYSDWSTQPWPMESKKKHNSSETLVQVPLCCIRLHCRGESFVVEAKFPPKGPAEEEAPEWEFIRIAHLSPGLTTTNETLATPPSPIWQGPQPTSSDEMWAGVFACCPQDQQGGVANFTHFSIQEGSHMDHHA